MIITQDMVGKSVGLFTAVEVKTPTGRVSKDQKNFIDTVIRLGGLAGVARHEDDLSKIIDPYQ